MASPYIPLTKMQSGLSQQILRDDDAMTRTRKRADSWEDEKKQWDTIRKQQNRQDDEDANAARKKHTQSAAPGHAKGGPVKKVMPKKGHAPTKSKSHAGKKK